MTSTEARQKEAEQLILFSKAKEICSELREVGGATGDLVALGFDALALALKTRKKHEKT